MEQISGYARVLARARVEQQQNKPFFGKPYLKLGQCYALWAYFFQLGGILGAKHSAELDAFGTAFIGARGEPGAVLRFFTEVAKRLVPDSVTESMTFVDYVSAEFNSRVSGAVANSQVTPSALMEKVPRDTAEELAWQYSTDGAALGAIYPNMVRKMFERTHAPVSKEKWDFARAAGLDISPEQILMSYEETEEAENEVFMAYCQECCPSLYSILKS